jgi:hypothetical protein
MVGYGTIDSKIVKIPDCNIETDLKKKDCIEINSTNECGTQIIVKQPCSLRFKIRKTENKKSIGLSLNSKNLLTDIEYIPLTELLYITSDLALVTFLEKFVPGDVIRVHGCGLLYGDVKIRIEDDKRGKI